MVAVTVDLVTSASLYKMVAATLPKRPCTLEMLRWVMLKSTSLCAGSEVQVEVCARARGAASARMPVTNTKRLIGQFPFDAGPLGRFSGIFTGTLRCIASPEGRRSLLIAPI